MYTYTVCTHIGRDYWWKSHFLSYWTAMPTHAHRHKDIKNEGSQILSRHLCILIPWNCRSPLWVTEMRDMRQVWALVHISWYYEGRVPNYLTQTISSGRNLRERLLQRPLNQRSHRPQSHSSRFRGGSMILLKVTHSITLSYIIITSPSVGSVWISLLGLPRTHRFWTLISHS